jgi:hypothetical protein
MEKLARGGRELVRGISLRRLRSSDDNLLIDHGLLLAISVTVDCYSVCILELIIRTRTSALPPALHQFPGQKGLKNGSSHEVACCRTPSRYALRFQCHEAWILFALCEVTKCRILDAVKCGLVVSRVVIDRANAEIAVLIAFRYLAHIFAVFISNGLRILLVYLTGACALHIHDDLNQVTVDVPALSGNCQVDRSWWLHVGNRHVRINALDGHKSISTYTIGRVKLVQRDAAIR